MVVGTGQTGATTLRDRPVVWGMTYTMGCHGMIDSGSEANHEPGLVVRNGADAGSP